MSLAETTSKMILINLLENTKISNTLKVAIVDEFVADTSNSNIAFQTSFNSLKQAVQDNNEK